MTTPSYEEALLQITCAVVSGQHTSAEATMAHAVRITGAYFDRVVWRQNLLQSEQTTPPQSEEN